MRHNPSQSCRDGKERKQKETHSEIERKRRERMKRETEFLQQQLNARDCHDRLSVFQQGSDELNEYTSVIGDRQYIFKPEEFTELVIDNFKGFDIHISCEDGTILHVGEKIITILGYESHNIIMKNFSDLVASSESIIKSINSFTQIESDDLVLLNKGETIPRNIILPLIVKETQAISNPDYCVPDHQNNILKFIEIYGEISMTDLNIYIQDKDETNGVKTQLVPIYKALCRELKPSSALKLEIKAPYFTCRHSPIDLKVLEVIGLPKLLINLKADEIIDQTPNRFLQSVSQESIIWEQIFKQAQDESSTTIFTNIFHRGINRRIRLNINITAIKIGPTIINCFVSKYSLAEGQNETLLALNRWYDTQVSKLNVRSSNSKPHPIFYTSQSIDEFENCETGIENLLDRFRKNSLAPQEFVVCAGSSQLITSEKRESSQSTLKSNEASESSLSSRSSSNSIRHSTALKKNRRFESSEEFPDALSFKDLVVGEDIAEELFDPPNIQKLIEEDVTDVIN